MSNAQRIIKRLLRSGISKWEISRKVGVQWKTVRYWEQGFTEPTEENMRKLEELNNENE